MNDAAPISGSNQPPFLAQLELETEADRAAAAALLASYASSVVADDAGAAAARRLAEQMRARELVLKGIQQDKRAPFALRVAEVDDLLLPLIKQLSTARSNIRTMLTTYTGRRRADAAAQQAALESEQRRLREAAAEKTAEAVRLGQDGAGSQLDALKLEEEAERLQRKGLAVMPSPIRTDLGSVGERAGVEFEITDLSMCIRGLMKSHRGPLEEAINEIVRRHLNSLGAQHAENANLPGVRAWPVTKAILAR